MRGFLFGAKLWPYTERDKDLNGLDPARMSLTTAIGVMSGTSMDAIDVAIIRTDGQDHVEPGPGRAYPYAPELRARLLAVLADPAQAEHDPMTALEEAVSDAHAGAVERFLHDLAIDPANIDLVGIHGQTIFHKAEARFTRQFGIGARMAAYLGIDVVTRFRHADVAAGGEGAPLAPLYHKALASRLDQPLMVLNLGGVANVTYLDGDTVIAFDTGPASALLDDFLLRRRGEPFDRDGALAASGTPDPALLEKLLSHPYFTRPAPKSLDRNAFHAWAAEIDRINDDARGAATLTAFTVASVASAAHLVPGIPKFWLVTGGGRHNLAIMDSLRQALGVPVMPVEAVGWDGDFLEAQCFAYLAVRSRAGLPLSLPTTTGAPHPLSGGEFWPAS
jgi:anhydro-N-acetylmuramic acid kinase